MFHPASERQKDDPEAALSRKESEGLVRHALAQLPDKYRLPIVYAAIDAYVSICPDCRRSPECFRVGGGRRGLGCARRVGRSIPIAGGNAQYSLH